MSKKGTFSVKRPGSSEMALQITSMADIFTIILVFLLKSYATGALNVNPSPGLRLPQATTGEAEVTALNVEVSENAVQVENTFVAKLDHFRFAAGDVAPSGIPTPLDRALEAQRKRQDLIAKSNSDVRVDDKIVLVADQRTPYLTLKSVLSAAALHGFTDFKLVVLKKE